MNKITSAFNAFATDENAATSIEYALMAALLTVSIVIAIKVVGSSLIAACTSVGAMFDNAFP